MNSTVRNKLWTRDFTIITLGSAVSMLGNTMSGFAMGLLVLDYTNSSLLYAVYMIVYTLPQIITPIFSGALLDRFSRKKTIYTLDFISAGLYMTVATLFLFDLFNIVFFMCFAFLVGIINSFYMVAYSSFYPLLISEGNYQKAYSIEGILETFSALMIPVATFFYKMLGIMPLFYVNGGFFLIAAIMEIRIRQDEEYIENQRKSVEGEQVGAFRRMFMDIREGLHYMKTEKSLLAVTLYFFICFLAYGATSVLTLPYFKTTFPDGEYVYMLVWGMGVVGRMIGGLIHYKFRLPVKSRYRVALSVYIIIALLEAFYLYCPIPVMMAMCFLAGIGGVTSYTIRISATQSYVPHEKKGRFNGAFNMMTTVGSLIGQMSAGALSVVMGTRTIIMIYLCFNALAAIVIIGGAGRHVKQMYNRQR
ncbi:MAG: MFS transporter [Lachnospiraceae bacterium]|jgi:MFS family permease